MELSWQSWTPYLQTLYRVEKYISIWCKPLSFHISCARQWCQILSDTEFKYLRNVKPFIASLLSTSLALSSTILQTLGQYHQNLSSFLPHPHIYVGLSYFSDFAQACPLNILCIFIRLLTFHTQLRHHLLQEVCLKLHLRPSGHSLCSHKTLGILQFWNLLLMFNNLLLLAYGPSLPPHKRNLREQTPHLLLRISLSNASGSSVIMF